MTKIIIQIIVLINVINSVNILLKKLIFIGFVC